MDELKGAAVAYYNNGSYIQQEVAKDFFKAMDTDGDGKVTWEEFCAYLLRHGYRIDRNLYNKLDQNGNGGLDFRAVLTVYYIILTRTLACNCCDEHLLGLYFVCVECFNKDDNTYNLCITCYAKKKFRHHHAHFLDNHMLLMRKKREALATDNPNQALAPVRPQNPAITAKDIALATLHALEAALGVVKSALDLAGGVSSCTVM